MTRQTEPEWDDAARGDAEGLARHDQEACPGCGLHSSVLADPENHAFTLEDRLCEVCAGQEIHARLLGAAQQEWEKAHPEAPAKQRRPGDGLHTFMRQLTPREAAERRTREKTTRKGDA